MSKHLAKVFSLALIFALMLNLLPAQVQRAGAITTSIVISQVYGGGGNTGAPYQQDYIVLYNPGTAAVDLSTWSVQYASSGGSTWTNKTNLSGTIQPGQYFLVAEAPGTSCINGTPCGSPLPTPDVTGTIFMSGSSGKVALVYNQDLLACGSSCAGNIYVRDFVGF